MSAEPALLSHARAEILGLHDFFILWFTGRIGQAAGFERCEDALHADFTMVAPDGSLHSRRDTMARIRDAHGSARPDFSIQIEDVQPLWQDEDAILVSYVEAQSQGGGITRRRSSALFVGNGPVRPGLAWLHLHETWM